MRVVLFMPSIDALCLILRCPIYITRSLGALRAPTSSLWPFGPPFGPSGLLDFVLRALRALRPCDPRTVASGTDVLIVFFVFFCIFGIFFVIFGFVNDSFYF